MGQQPHFSGTMNPGTMNSPAKTSARASGYHQKAMAEIHNSLLPFAKSASSEFATKSNSNNTGGPENVGSSAASTISTLSTTSGVSSASGMSTGSINGNGLNADIRQSLQQLVAMGYAEDSSMRALQLFGGRIDAALDFLVKQQTPQDHKSTGLTGYSTKLIRKPSLERELNLHRGSPALDSGAGSSRSDSPRMSELINHPQVSRQYSPSEFGEPPPPPPPRCSSTPPPPPPPIHVQYQAAQAVQHVPSNVQQLFKRMSPAPVVPSRPSPVLPGSSVAPSNQRGTSPVAACPPTPTGVAGSSGRQPMVIQNGPQVQQQLTQQIQALSLYQTGGNSAEPPPPYPLIPTSPSVASAPPPSYTASIQSRQSPTQSQQDYRKSPSSGIYSGPTSAGSPSPVPVSTATPTAMARPTPLQAWGARQTKTQPPIIMQSVKSTQVQKPVLQTAIAPTSPQIATTSTPASPSQLPPPSYASSIQQKQQHQQQQQQQQKTPIIENNIPNANSLLFLGEHNYTLPLETFQFLQLDQKGRPNFSNVPRVDNGDLAEADQSRREAENEEGAVGGLLANHVEDVANNETNVASASNELHSDLEIFINPDLNN